MDVMYVIGYFNSIVLKRKPTHFRDFSFIYLFKATFLLTTDRTDMRNYYLEEEEKRIKFL